MLVLDEREALWQGVTAHARRRRPSWPSAQGPGRVVRRRHRHRQEPGDIGRFAMQAHVKGANGTEAVEAGRRLVAEKAGWRSPSVTIDVEPYCACKWQPEAE